MSAELAALGGMSACYFIPIPTDVVVRRNRARARALGRAIKSCTACLLDWTQESSLQTPLYCQFKSAFENAGWVVREHYICESLGTTLCLQV